MNYQLFQKHNIFAHQYQKTDENRPKHDMIVEKRKGEQR